MKPPPTTHPHRNRTTYFVLAILASLAAYVTGAAATGTDPECRGNGPKKVCPIVNPQDGATVVGTVEASASFRDASVVSSVQFLVDDAILGPLDTTAPFTATWDTTKVPNGSHNLIAVAFDTGGDKSVAINNVTVNNPAPDTTAPTAAITSPAAGATVSGQVNVGASASDNVGVAGVQFKLDGATLGAEDTSAPYTASWNSASSANGQHTLSAVARDAAGNKSTAQQSVNVSNGTGGTGDTTLPSVQLTSPAAGATVTGQVSVAANATDNVGVAGVQFKLDGANLGSEDTSAPYSTSWNSATSTNGQHTMSAVARDAAGNRSTVQATVNVSNSTATPTPTPGDTTAPSVQVTAPAGGATVADQVLITASATDNVGVAGVQFKLDGANLGSEDTGAPYTASWNTTMTTDGQHTLSAVARDAAGNRSTAQATTVNVSNNPAAPAPSGLPFAEAQLRSGYLTMTVPATTYVVDVPAGKDALIDLQKIKRAKALQIRAWGDSRIKVLNGYWDINIPVANETCYWRGGPRIYSPDGSGPAHVSFTNMLVTGSTLCDGIAIGAGANTKVTIQRTRVEYPTTNSTEPTYHLDALQLQGPVGEVEVGLSTLYVSGVQPPNHGGKALQLETWTPTVTIRVNKVNMYGTGDTGTFIFQYTRNIRLELTDAWALKEGTAGFTWSSGSGLFYPNSSNGATYSWYSTGTAPNRTADWPDSANIYGVVREGRPGGQDYLTRGMLGY
jgi:hypothetical protein